MRVSRMLKSKKENECKRDVVRNDETAAILLVIDMADVVVVY